MERVGADPVLGHRRTQSLALPHRRRAAGRDAPGLQSGRLGAAPPPRRGTRPHPGAPGRSGSRRIGAPRVARLASASAAAAIGVATPDAPEPGVALDEDGRARDRLARAAPASPSSSRSSSTETLTVARRSSASSRASFVSPTRLYGMSRSSKPASAITSASPSFWQVSTDGAAASCRRAISTHLCVFTCGRLASPSRSVSACQRSRLRLEPVEVDDREPAYRGDVRSRPVPSTGGASARQGRSSGRLAAAFGAAPGFPAASRRAGLAQGFRG